MKEGKQAVAFLKKSSAKDFLLILYGILKRPPGRKKVLRSFFKSDRLLAILLS